jgi:hypothetical protein
VVGTADGVGTVVETRTLVQLVLVRLHATGQDIALPVEDLLPPEQAPQPSAPPAPPAGDQRPGVGGGKRPRRDGPRGDGPGGKRTGDRR